MPTIQEHEFSDHAPEWMTYYTHQRYMGLHYMLMSLQMTLQPEYFITYITDVQSVSTTYV